MVTFILRYPRSTLFCTLLLVSMLAAFIPDLRKESRNDAYMPAQHPAMVAREKVQELFALRDPIVLLVVSDDQRGVFNPDTLRLLRHLTRAVSLLPGVLATHVSSLSASTTALPLPTHIAVRPLIEENADFEDTARIREWTMRVRPFLGRLVSRDGRASAIVAELASGADALDVYTQILALVADAPATHEQIFVAGEGAANGYVGAYIDRDALRMNPLAALVIAILLCSAYRTARGVLIPIVVICVSLLVTLGAMAACGVPFYPITSGLTVVLIGISVTDPMHILGSYYRTALDTSGLDRKTLVSRTMAPLVRPVVLTSLTSIAGFGALSVSAFFPPLRAFGTFGMVGMAAELLVSLLAVPALLVLLPPRTSRVISPESPTTPRSDLIGSCVAKAATFSVRRPTIIVGAALCALPICLTGIARVSIEDEAIRYFRADEPIRLADGAINAHMDGTHHFDVLVQTQAGQDLLNPERLQQINALEKFIRTLPGVSSTRSIVEYLKQINWALTERYGLPQHRETVAQYLLLFGDPRELAQLVDSERTSANIRVTMSHGRWSDDEKVIPHVEQYIKDRFDDQHAKAIVAGTAFANYSRLVELRRSHWQGVALALAVVVAVAIAGFGSVSSALLSMVPVMVALCAMYAAMGFAGVWLSLGNGMAAAISLGLTVDYGIHVTEGLLTKARSTDEAQFEHEVGTMFAFVGRALWFNCMAVACGFGVLLTSEIPVVREFGLLVVVCVIAGFATSITLLPALAQLRRAIWLGQE